MPSEDRLAGTLLGTALGDAPGLPAEGMWAPAIARRFGRVERFHLLGRTGFVVREPAAQAGGGHAGPALRSRLRPAVGTTWSPNR